MGLLLMRERGRERGRLVGCLVALEGRVGGGNDVASDADDDDDEEEVTATEEEGKEDCRTRPLLPPVPPTLSLSLLMPTGLMLRGST